MSTLYKRNTKISKWMVAYSLNKLSNPVLIVHNQELHNTIRHTASYNTIRHTLLKVSESNP